MTDTPLVFDRRALRRHRDRAAPGFPAHDFLMRHAAEGLVDRLGDIRRDFPTAAAIGSRRGLLRPLLMAAGRVATLVELELSAAMLGRAGPGAVADPEWLPLADSSIDLAISALELHWINDLPGTLAQIRRALRPDGLLLASLLGGETLAELRTVLLEAESEVSGGAAPRVSPVIDVRDAGALLQRAGFALPVVDSLTVTASYPDALALMRDLRGMGETGAALARPRRFTPRAVLLRAGALYAERYGTPDGRIPARFEIITLTAWAPHAAQPRPLRPGSATARLADALGTDERPLDPRPGRGEGAERQRGG